MGSSTVQGWQRRHDAVRLAEGGPAEAGSLSASSLPWSIDHPGGMPNSPLNNLRLPDDYKTPWNFSRWYKAI